MIRRCEILAVPGDVATAVDIDALEHALISTLDRPAPRRIAVGPWLLLLATDGAIIGGPDDDLVLREGAWPDPVSLRLLVDRSGWALQTDARGTRPIYVSDTAPVASTRPDLVSALTEPALDPVGCSELLQFGFTLETRTIFRGVRRLFPGAAARGTNDGALRVVEPAAAAPPEPSSGDWTARVASIIHDATRRGHVALELSGGVDSRLVLAIARRYDVMPALAMTVGSEDDEEVVLARRICDECRLTHVAVEPKVDHDEVADDARTFVARAGYAVPAGPVAWMPRVFAKLEAHRDTQLGGGGGECATGFYYSPFDVLLHSRSGRRAWIERRLSRQDVDLVDLFGAEDGRALHGAAVDHGVGMLARQHGGARARLDGVYETQRVPNAGGPILSACSAWYRPVQPLLAAPHLAWARTVGAGERVGRRAQLQVLHELDPDLAAIPFSHARRFRASIPGQVMTRLATFRRSAERTARRLRMRGGTAERLGAGSAMTSILRCGEARATLRGLCTARELPLTEQSLVTMMSAAAPQTHALGTLLSIAWGRESARSIRQDIIGAVRDEATRSRRAA